MTIGLYPPHKVKELTTVYLRKDKPPYPDFVKKIHNWGAGVQDGKYRVIAVYECPDDKLREALIAIGTRHTLYGTVEGYSYEAIPLVSEAEAMKMIQGL
jgi:hypothetical protein